MSVSLGLDRMGLLILLELSSRATGPLWGCPQSKREPGTSSASLTCLPRDGEVPRVLRLRTTGRSSPKGPEGWMLGVLLSLHREYGGFRRPKCGLSSAPRLKALSFSTTKYREVPPESP